eukprot:EG_transcript_1992
MEASTDNFVKHDTPDQPSKTSPEPMEDEGTFEMTEHVFESIRDKKGILYAIGCEDSGSWKNPVSTKKVTVTASSTYRGTPSMVADHTFACQIFYTDNKPYSWVRIDFKGASVCPNHYSMAHRAGFDGYYLRDWQLQASNDAQQWVVLQEHKGDEALNKKSLVAAWPIEGCQTFYRYFQVVIAPNGNSNNTNALILSCFELYGTLKRPIVHPPAPEQACPLSSIASANGWQTCADGSRPLPFRVVAATRSTMRPGTTPFGNGEPNVALPEATALCKGRVVSVSWQGGSIQLLDYPESSEFVPYHKSDVWVDDKKVKQLPREGDLVSFYIVVDEITKKEKAEQVTVVNHQRKASAPGLSIPDGVILSAPIPAQLVGGMEAQAPDATEGGLKVAVRKSISKATENATKLNPEAPSFTPKFAADPPTLHSTDAILNTETDPSPVTTSGSVQLEPKSSFLFEHCTGRVVQVSVPTGQIQIDGAPEGAPTIPYHYSDVWDDGKCVKQFPRVGDTVSCYIGIDPKTKKEKAENVKVICKKQHSDDAPERIQVRQTIQNARYRAAANVANVTFRGTGIPNGGAPSTQRIGPPFAAPPMFFDHPVPRVGPDVHATAYGMQDPNMTNYISPRAFAHPPMPVMPNQVPRCPLPFGYPQPPAVNMSPMLPQAFANNPPVQQPMLLGYPNQFPMGNGMGPVSTPTKGFLPQYSTFAPVVGSPNRGGVGAPLTPPSSAVLPAASPILPMQYTEGASPMLYSVGASRNSPPQSPSPSPSTGLSLSSNSSLGTLNASCSEVEACPQSLDMPAHTTPSPASQSPFDNFHEELLQKSVEYETMHGLMEEYSCRTPEKRYSGLSAWTAGDIFGLPGSDRLKKARAGHHDALETLLPRSPIIGDILRPTDDEHQDELLDHDLLSGDSALVALHAVSVLDF